MSITSKEEMVTPRMAKNWLENQGENRPLSRFRVKQYADAMRRLEWESNGESIKFDDAGRLMDGQHRLAAIVECGIPVPLMVVRGVSRGVFGTIGIGQRRSLAQVLKMRGEAYANNLAALANFAFTYASGEDIRTRTHFAPTFTQAERFIEDNPQIRDSAATGYLVGRHLGCSQLAMGFCHFLFSLIDENDTEAFFSSLRDGEGLHAGDPVLVLRRRLMRDGTWEKMYPPEQAAITIKAWNAWRQGRKVSVLAWRPGGKNPEKFPLPE